MAPIQTAQTALDKIDQDEQDAKDAAARAVVTKAAMTKLTAMNAEAAQTTDAGLGGTARDRRFDGRLPPPTTYTAGTDDDVYTLSIKRDRDGTEVDDRRSGIITTRPTPSSMDQMAGLDSGRYMFVRTQDEDEDGDVEEEVVIVGTDIRAPVDEAVCAGHGSCPERPRPRC